MGIQINGQTDTVTATDGSINVGGDVTIPGVLTYEDVTNVDSVGIVTAQSGIHVTGGSVGIGTDNPGQKLQIQDGHIDVTNGSGHSYSFSYGKFTAERSAAQTTSEVFQGGYTGNTETSKIYADGKAYFLNNVGIGTDNPGSNKLQIQGSSAFYGNGGASATWGDTSYLGALSFDGSAQPVIRAASSKALIFQVNQSTEALRITSAGDVGINRPTPSATLDVESASDQTVLRLRNNIGNDTRLLLSNKAAGIGEIAYKGDFRFVDNENSDAERLRITSTGAIGIGSNFTAIETTGGGGITLDSGSGGGNIGVFLKSTGYTGNQTKLWQDSANAVSYLESTERPLIIKAGDGAGDYIRMDVAGSERLHIDSNGNLGVNKTPETDWASSYRAIEIGNSSVSAYQGSSYPSIELNMNCRGTQASYGAGWKYILGMRATQIHLPYSGETIFRRATSGSVDGTISWVESMRLTNDGDLQYDTNKGGIYNFDKACSANASTNIFRIDNDHGAHCFTIYMTCSNSGNSVSKIYNVACQFGSNPTINAAAETAGYSSNNFSLTGSVSGKVHTFAISVTGAAATIACTVVLGSMNTNATVTKL